MRILTIQPKGLWRFALLAAMLAVGVMPPAYADGAVAPSRVPVPHIEIGKGDKCVADEEFMRKNHMKMLMHHRDETVHEGIRTTQYSLKNCIECHASKKNNSVLGSNENFCQSCHSYAAVKIDCFECHANKPKAAGAFHPVVAGAGQVSGLGAAMRKEMHGDADKTLSTGAAK
ncbi:MAG: hypothetical protein ACYC2R_05180 [Burkholderiales bacterium]